MTVPSNERLAELAASFVTEADALGEQGFTFEAETRLEIAAALRALIAARELATQMLSDADEDQAEYPTFAIATRNYAKDLLAILGPAVAIEGGDR
jgi:Mlc titration factor MtfA (ptsG expression regulator)